jgi:hypothetical protein
MLGAKLIWAVLDCDFRGLEEALINLALDR